MGSKETRWTIRECLPWKEDRELLEEPGALSYAVDPEKIIIEEGASQQMK